MNKQDIIAEFSDNLTEYFAVSDYQRDEITRSWQYMNNHNMQDIGTQGKDSLKPTPVSTKKRKTNISLLPAIVRGVAGSEVMQERHIDIVAIENDDFDVEADIMDDAVSYAQYASGWKSAFDMVKRDAAVCGIGATVSMLDMTKADAVSGVPDCKRIFPSFLFYDTSGLGQDLNKTANWCGYADPMRRKELEKYVEKKMGGKTYLDAGFTSFSAQFTEDTDDTEMNVDMLYHYFWKENETYHDTENPLYTDDVFKEVMASNDIATELMGEWSEQVNVNLEAPFWTLEAKQFKDLKKTLEAIEKLSGEEFDVQSSVREVKVFYRGEFALGQCLSKSKAYSQIEFPLNFVTGYFDEEMGVYYGFTRPISFVQDALNIVMDDLLDYSHSAATGGKIYAKGAADDLKLLKSSKANEDDVTPISLTTEIIPKELASSPQVLLSTAQLLIELMPRSIGVGQEFLGMVSSGDMTDSLFGRIIKQSFAVLQDFANSSAGYSKRQGQIFIDMMLSVAKVEDGRVLPVLSPGHTEQDYFSLSKQNLARQYVIRIVERPVTDDENMENMKVLTQLAPNMQAAGVNILPAIIENMRMDHGQKQDLLEMAKPKPQEPNPMDIEMVKSNIRLLNAQAAKLESDAQEKSSPLTAEETQSIIEKNLAQATKSMADAGAVDKDLTIKAINTFT